MLETRTLRAYLKRCHSLNKMSQPTDQASQSTSKTSHQTDKSKLPPKPESNSIPKITNSQPSQSDQQLLDQAQWLMDLQAHPGWVNYLRPYLIELSGQGYPNPQ